MLSFNAVFNRETQNFASLLGRYPLTGGMFLIAHIGMGGTGDARFCVSTQARAMIITGMSHVRQSSYSLCRSVPAAFMTYCTSMRAVSISMV